MTARLALASSLVLLALPAAAQSPTLLELQNTAAINRAVVDSSGTLLMSGTFGSGAIQTPGQGIFMMWYPRRAAFRAGFASSTQMNDGNVGDYSIAAGFGTRASGYAATAFGQGTTASGSYSVALGQNSDATANSAFVAGSVSHASAYAATALGDGAVASGQASVAMGTNTTASGSYTTALGSNANTNTHTGSFVWGDASTNTALMATGPNQFSLRAAGGVRIFTNSGMSVGVSLAPGGNSWLTISDRSRKENFAVLDGEDLLARVQRVPVSAWNYIGQAETGVRHIGPMAQDWHRAFALNEDSTTLNMSDLEGVTLGAVQALVERSDRLARQNALQAEQFRDLLASHAILLERIERLEKASTGDGRPD